MPAASLRAPRRGALGASLENLDPGTLGSAAGKPDAALDRIFHVGFPAIDDPIVSDAEYDRLLARLSTLLEATLGEIRNFIGAFRPPDFAHRQLTDIIQGLLMHHEMATGCQVEFDVGERPFPPHTPPLNRLQPLP